MIHNNPESRMRVQTLPRRCLIISLVALAPLACGGGDGPPTEPQGGPATLELSPTSLSFGALGDSAQLTAAVEDAGGHALTDATVTWTSTDATIATVSSTGWVKSVAEGNAQVIATTGEGAVSDTVVVVVGQAPASIVLTVPDDTLAEGESVQVTITVFDANGVEIPGETIIWTSSDETVATVDATGQVTAVWGEATATITATAGDVSLGTDITVLGKILFATDRTGGADLYLMNTDGSGLERLTTSDAVDNYPAWSPDGRKIAFVSHRDGNDEIYTMNADGTGLVRLTTDPGAEASPAWSPDGSKIAFVSDRDGDQEIYVMNADGTVLNQLTTDPAPDVYPSWAPDGTQIAFASDRNGTRQIFLMTASGTGVTAITGTGNTAPVWSPDGSRIAFTSGRDDVGGDIYVMNADGSDVVRLTESLGQDGATAWSPDGSKLLFFSERSGNVEIYVMGADGSEPTRLTDHIGIDVWARWRPRPVD